MKLSRFNLWVKDYPKKDEYLLFNSRTQALIKINQELKQILDNLSDSVLHSYPSPIEENIKTLKDNGIIVEDEKDEEKKLENFFQQLKYNNSALPFEVTILTTYSCNFKCVYCFEESVKESVFLDKTDSDLIVKWIINRAEKKQVKNIFLVYYGGEPLLNVWPIYNISWHLKQWADSNGVRFGFGIITNGSLINPELIDKLLAVGLKELRISIDGYRQEHNKKRPFTNGMPTFDIIIDNIKSVIDKVRVGIMGNFDRENYESIFRFLDYLENEGLFHKFEKINFSPLMPRLGKKSNPGKIELG
ncbi:MAG: radical SAM protein, partial [Candidatus Omnitrophica bacterium]|nr:radical SAM protein [Candidatus Omnitrophota bacterium]